MKLISALFKTVLGILSKFFGSFFWTPPPWSIFFRNFSSSTRSLASRFTSAIRELIKIPRKRADETSSLADKPRGINFKRLGKALAAIFGRSIRAGRSGYRRSH